MVIVHIPGGSHLNSVYIHDLSGMQLAEAAAGLLVPSKSASSSQNVNDSLRLCSLFAVVRLDPLPLVRVSEEPSTGNAYDSGKDGNHIKMHFTVYTQAVAPLLLILYTHTPL